MVKSHLLKDSAIEVVDNSNIVDTSRYLRRKRGRLESQAEQDLT